jgi:hypothetical protein
MFCNIACNVVELQNKKIASQKTGWGIWLLLANSIVDFSIDDMTLGPFGAKMKLFARS